MPATIESFIDRFKLDDDPRISVVRTPDGASLDNGRVHIDWRVTQAEFEALIRRYNRDAIDALGSPDGISLLVSRFYERLESSSRSGVMTVRRKSLVFTPYEPEPATEPRPA